MSRLGLERRDFATLTKEDRWQPPAFGSARTFRERAAAKARRSLDLQAASIWNDLTVLFAQLRGDVLDVGAGAQPYRGLLPEAVRYRAIDVKLADAFGYDQPDTEYYDQDDPWPVAAASVDVVFATETLEHVPEPAGFLDEARRVLRADGHLLLTVPFSARWHYIPHDYWRYTPSSLRNLLGDAGFTDISVYARGNEVSVACAKTMALLLPGLLPPEGGFGIKRILSLFTLPLLFVLAAIGQASLRGTGGDDCLGWTVIATAPTDGGSAASPAQPSPGA